MLDHSLCSSFLTLYSADYYRVLSESLFIMISGEMELCGRSSNIYELVFFSGFQSSCRCRVLRPTITVGTRVEPTVRSMGTNAGFQVVMSVSDRS